LVTAAQKTIKNSNHLYVRNVLHFKLVKLQSIWKSGSGQICHSKSGKNPAGLEENKSGTALSIILMCILYKSNHYYSRRMKSAITVLIILHISNTSRQNISQQLKEIIAK